METSGTISQLARACGSLNWILDQVIKCTMRIKMIELLSCFVQAARKVNKETLLKLSPTGKNIMEAYHEKAKKL